MAMVFEGANRFLRYAQHVVLRCQRYPKAAQRFCYYYVRSRYYVPSRFYYRYRYSYRYRYRT